MTWGLYEWSKAFVHIPANLSLPCSFGTKTRQLSLSH